MAGFFVPVRPQNPTNLSTMERKLSALPNLIGNLMDGKDPNPFGYPIWTYLWVFGLAGAAGLLKALKQKQTLRDTAIDVGISALSGLVTFWFCEANAVNPLYSAILIAVSGHMGTKAWTRISDIVMDKFFPNSKHHLHPHDSTLPPSDTPKTP